MIINTKSRAALSARRPLRSARALFESARPALRRSAPRAKTRVQSYGAGNTKWLNECLDKWGDLVECTNGYAPIRNNWNKAVTAAMFDNQHKLARARGFRGLNEAAATTTSVFGPKYGTNGGALHSGDNFAPGDFRNPVSLMPVIRRTFPALVANEVVGVQPMPNSSAYAVAIRYKYLRGANAPADSSVLHTHTNSGQAPEEGGYDLDALRGIQAKYSYKHDTKTLTVLDVHGFPKTIAPLAFAKKVLVDGEVKYSAVAHPAVEKVIGVVDLSSAAEQDDAETAITAAETAIDTAFGGADKQGYYIGMSQQDAPEGAVNPDNDELGFVRTDTRFTGAVDKRLEQPLAGGLVQFRPEDTGVAAWVQSYEATAAIARTSFDFKRIIVEAGSRKIATSWTPELEEDLNNNSGIDINEQAITMLTYELTAEIDRECHVRMLFAALYNGSWSVWHGENADARWHGERAHALYLDILKQSIRMEARNHRGPANFLIVSPDVAAHLQGLELFQPMPGDVNIQTNNLAVAKIGTLGGTQFSVYIDTKSPIYDLDDYGYGLQDKFDTTVTPEKGMPNYVLLGYKGADAFDAGIIFCPYIPMMMHSATDPYNWTTQLGLSTRYGICDHIFGAELYYHVILVSGLGQPGLPEEVKKYYPAGSAPAGAAPISTGFAVPVQATISGEIKTTGGDV